MLHFAILICIWFYCLTQFLLWTLLGYMLYYSPVLSLFLILLVSRLGLLFSNNFLLKLMRIKINICLTFIIYWSYSFFLCAFLYLPLFCYVLSLCFMVCIQGHLWGSFWVLVLSEGVGSIQTSFFTNNMGGLGDMEWSSSHVPACVCIQMWVRWLSNLWLFNCFLSKAFLKTQF